MTLKTVRSLAEADAHDPVESALVETTAAFAGPLLALLATAKGEGSARRRKLARALLKAAATR